MLARKKVGNPAYYFHKTFAEYQKGFCAKGELKLKSIYNIFIHIPSGESWLGLDNLHSLTSQQDYKLKITMTDFDGKKYIAVYDQFVVRQQTNQLKFKLDVSILPTFYYWNVKFLV